MRRAFAVLALGLLALSPGAQEEAEPKRPETPPPGFRGRDRDFMHPGDPLVVVGLEETDNDIRSRTPALANSDRRAALVDADELYARKLALYDGRVFARPLERRDLPRDRDFDDGASAAHPSRPAPLEHGDPSGVPWIAMAAAAVFAGSIAAILVHRHNASMMARRAH